MIQRLQVFFSEFSTLRQISSLLTKVVFLISSLFLFTMGPYDIFTATIFIFFIWIKSRLLSNFIDNLRCNHNHNVDKKNKNGWKRRKKKKKQKDEEPKIIDAASISYQKVRQFCKHYKTEGEKLEELNFRIFVLSQIMLKSVMILRVALTTRRKAMIAVMIFSIVIWTLVTSAIALLQI